MSNLLPVWANTTGGSTLEVSLEEKYEREDGNEGKDIKYIRGWEDEDKVQVRDGVKCEKAALGNNKVWLQGAVCEVMHWGDGDLVRGRLRWEEIPWRALLCLCLPLEEHGEKEQPYLCSLSSSSSTYLVAFSFSRLSAWRQRHKKENAYCHFHLPAFIGRDVVS